ncbi:hypothetical protein V6N12_042685 [Hibiscus sabdariffa]|uniref:Uncharacterized protein n=1 Tax=Hibiscus sabdariffa TaxID=183260 RepID=A0ABR2B5L7_9ROSI
MNSHCIKVCLINKVNKSDKSAPVFLCLIYAPVSQKSQSFCVLDLDYASVVKTYSLVFTCFPPMPMDWEQAALPAKEPEALPFCNITIAYGLTGEYLAHLFCCPKNQAKDAHRVVIARSIVNRCNSTYISDDVISDDMFSMDKSCESTKGSVRADSTENEKIGASQANDNIDLSDDINSVYVETPTLLLVRTSQNLEL